MPLEEDLRHIERNTEARQRSIEALGPAVKECVMLIMEMNEDELRQWRDDVKDRMRIKQRRSERANASFTELLKWGVVAAAGGFITWFSTHWKS